MTVTGGCRNGAARQDLKMIRMWSALGLFSLLALILTWLALPAIEDKAAPQPPAAPSQGAPSPAETEGAAACAALTATTQGWDDPRYRLLCAQNGGGR